MLHFDFCNRLAWHVHQPNRPTLEVTRDPLARRRHVRRSRAGAFWARRTGVPANSSSHEAFDDASRASVVELHAPRASACEVRARADPAGPRSKGPRSAPPSLRRFLPLPGRAPPPLTPFTTTDEHRSAARRWTRPPPRSRQGPRLGAHPGAFHRRMPARPCAFAPDLERGPATDRRASPPSTGFRRSFASSRSFGGG